MKTTHTSISGVLSTAAAVVLFPFILLVAGFYRLVRRLARMLWDDGNIYGLSPERRKKVMDLLDRRNRLSYTLIELDNLIADRSRPDIKWISRLRGSVRRDLKRVQRWLQFRHFINKGDVVKLSEREAGLFWSRFC